LVFIARHYSAEQPINIGSGEELSIAALADLIAEIVGFSGQVEFDSGKPDGTPRKLLDSSRLSSLGWAPSIPLEAGLRSTYADFASSAEQTDRQQHAAA
jgi:GDP-L-fucose synthase